MESIAGFFSSFMRTSPYTVQNGKKQVLLVNRANPPQNFNNRPSIPKLVRTWEEKDPESSCSKIKKLNSLVTTGTNTNYAARELIKLLRDEDPDIQDRVKEILIQLEEKAVVVLPELIEALRDRTLDVRSAAAEIINEIGPGAAPAVPALTKALQDPFSNIRICAAKALAHIGRGTKNVILTLEQVAQKDKNQTARYYAAIALNRLQGKPVIEELKKYIDEDLLRFGNRGTELQMRKAIKEIERLDQEASNYLPELASILEKTTDLRTKEKIVKILCDLPGEDVECAVNILIRLISDQNPNVRLYSVKALGHIADSEIASKLPSLEKEGVYKLVTVLEKEPVPSIRSEIAMTLGLIAKNPEMSIKALSKALKDSERIVRARAAYALGAFKKDDEIKAFIEPLIAVFTGDPDPLVKMYAEKSLRSLKVARITNFIDYCEK